MTVDTTTAPFSRLLIANVDGTARSVRHQQTELHRLHHAVIKAKADLIGAIKNDHDHSDFEATYEYCSTLSELQQHYESRDITVEVEKAGSLELGKDNLHRAAAVGLVYIVPTTHTPFYSVLSPLSAAIAAGNCVIVEIPQTTSRLSSVLRNLLTGSLNADTFAISKSRLSSDFLRRCQVVMQTDATDLPHGPEQRHLFSSPDRATVAIVDRSADVVQTARFLAPSRFRFGGTSPYAPDVIMVHEAVKDSLVEQLTKLLSEFAKDRSGYDVKKRSFAKKSSDDDDIWAQDTTTVASYSRNNIVEIIKPDSSLPGKKQTKPTLLLYSVTSMDHAIDRANTLGPLGASYVFGGSEECNYLANSVDAHMTCINQIATELLLGPLAPLHSTPRISPRFTVDMFQVPRPQLLVQSLVTQATSLPNPSSNAKFQKWVQTIQTPLAPIAQSDGKAVGFFEQALTMGGLVSVVTVSASIGLVVTAVMMRRLRR